MYGIHRLCTLKSHNVICLSYLNKVGKSTYDVVKSIKLTSILMLRVISICFGNLSPHFHDLHENVWVQRFSGLLILSPTATRWWKSKYEKKKEIIGGSFRAEYSLSINPQDRYIILNSNTNIHICTFYFNFYLYSYKYNYIYMDMKYI